MTTTDKGLVVTLLSDTEIRMTRAFNAPLHLVWEAISKPEHIKRWWGRGNPLDVTLDFRQGGAYRYVEHTPDGETHAFRGEFREIVPMERVVQTFEWEGMPGHIAVETLILEERDGKTLLTTTTVFSSKEERDGALNMGMEAGSAQSFDALEAVLAGMR
ncbi:MAG TPA: SRPBCC family protein [Micromonosporaceae bacterium]